MKNNKNQIWIGPYGESQHYRDALVCMVFSAFAVEYAITEFIWVRIGLQETQENRHILRKYRDIRMPARLRFVRRMSKLPKDLFRDMDRLFSLRNKLAHGRAILQEGEVDVVKIDRERKEAFTVREYRRWVAIPGLNSDFDDRDYSRIGLNILAEAEWCYEVAKRAVQAMDRELQAGV